MAELTRSRLRRLEFMAVASVAGFVVLMGVLSITAGAGDVLRRLAQIPPSMVAILLALSLVNYGLRAWRWQLQSNWLGLGVPWRRNLLYYFAGFSMTTTPGKAGEALRLWMLERCHGHHYGRVLPMFVADRMSDMTATLLLCLVGVGAFAGYAGVTLGVGAVLAVLFVLLLKPRVLLVIIGWGWQLVGRRWPRLFARFRQAVHGTRRLVASPVFLAGLVMALIGWGAEALGMALLLEQLGRPIGFQAALFVFTFGMIAGTASMLPGGLGGAEATMVALLGLLGVEFDIAVAATVVVRLATLWFATALGFVTLPFALRLARRQGGPVLA